MQLPPDQESIRARCFHPTGTFVEFPDSEQSIAQRFEEVVRRYPDRLAVGLDSGSLTYEQLNKAANRIAQFLIQQSVDREAPVALLFNQGAAIFPAILAVLKLGRIYVPLDAPLPLARLSDMLADSRAQLLLTETKHYSLAQNIARAGQQIIDCDRIPVEIPSANPALDIAPDAPALILYTSGSTGRPKGVLHTQRNIMVEATGYTNDIQICREDRISLCQSASFANSIRNIYGALLNGAALFPYDLANDGLARVPEWLRVHRITIFHTLESIVRRLRETMPESMSFPELRLLRFGGEPSSGAEVRYFQSHFAPQCVLMNVIGLTETFTIRRYFVSDEKYSGDTKVPLGYAVADKEILLLDESGAEVALGQVGEIAVRSKYIASGYWQRADLTRAAFLTEPSGSAERVYLTGDLAIMRLDGCLIHMGRKDFQVKIRGNRVEVTAVESALLKLESVQTAAVHPQDDHAGGQRLIAYIVPAPGRTLTLPEIRSALAPSLPEYMIPSALVLLDALPLVPNGRLDRAALPLPARTRRFLSQTYISPDSEIERQLASIWEEVLDIRPVGIDDNFLDLGGHSLAAARILARVVKRFRFDMPLRSLFEAPTIAQMARVIALGENLPRASSHATPVVLNSTPQYADIEPHQLKQLLSEIEALSEEEATGQLSSTSD